MALTVSFSAGQSPPSPNIIVLIDTSTGNDSSVVGRRIYITNYAGTALVPAGTSTSYIEWAGFPGTTTISVNVLTESTACNIRVDWINSGGTVLYSDSNTFCFDEYLKQMAYQLVQGLTPGITLNTNYSSALAQLWVAIKGGENAVVFANDIEASQLCLNQGTYLDVNQALFF